MFLTGIRKDTALKAVESQLSPDDLIKYIDAGTAGDRLAQVDIIRTIDSDTLKGLSGFVTETTGRGTLGPLERYLGPLNALLFAPRFVAGQVTRFRYVVDPRVPMPVRKYAVKKLAQFYGTLGTGLGLMGVAGEVSGKWDVEHDPRSTDFGKIKVGNQRFDITG